VYKKRKKDGKKSSRKRWGDFVVSTVKRFDIWRTDRRRKLHSDTRSRRGLLLRLLLCLLLLLSLVALMGQAESQHDVNANDGGG
jgi:hypothetical protein